MDFSKIDLEKPPKMSKFVNIEVGETFVLAGEYKEVGSLKTNEIYYYIKISDSLAFKLNDYLGSTSSSRDISGSTEVIIIEIEASKVYIK